jgi:uncharacterized protein (DUF1501 family)
MRHDGQFDRRRFLALGAGFASTGVLVGIIGPSAWDQLFGQGTSGGVPVTAAGARSGTGRTLVLVTLYGGNDGLNTVIPYGDPAYAATRGSLAIEPSTILPLGDGFGLHPSLTHLKGLWDERHLAVVHGVGFGDPNYSHFESMDIWQSGVPGEPVSTGWLGRWLDGTHASPLQALAIGPNVPPALVGQRVQAVAVPTGPLRLPGTVGERALFAQLAHSDSSLPPLWQEAAQANAELLVVEERLGPLLDHTASGSQPAGGSSAGALAIANGGGGRSGGAVLEIQLSVVANLILAGASPEVYSVELGGFDTHADQAGTQSALLAQLDAALGSFVDAVGADHRGRGKDVVVVVYTEFGRRVPGNASAGTDHGWANVVFVTGPRVRGGFYGETPSLSALSEGNLVYTTDFRRVYATAFEEVLGVSAKPFLGSSFRTFDLV